MYIMRDMDGVKGYFPSSSERAVVGTYSYDAQRMGGTPTITATLMYPRCLDKEWTRKEYVEYRGEMFYVRQTPSSSKDYTDQRYKHEITFVSEREILENVYFLDVVTSDTEEQYQDRYRSNSTNIHFFGDIHELVSRLNDSLLYSGLYDKNTKEGYRIVIDEGITSETKEVSADGVYVADVIQYIYTVFELPYYWVGKICHVGYAEKSITKILQYGEQDALISIQKSNANYGIANRITGHGGSTNLPYYYPNKSAEGDAIYNVINDETSVVEGISLADIMKYNPSPYTSYVLGYINPTNAWVETNCPLYYAGKVTSFEEIKTFTLDRSGFVGKIYKYKLYGLKGCRLTYPKANHLISFTKVEGGDNWNGSVRSYICEWTDEGSAPDEIWNKSETEEYTFTKDGWYEFTINVEISYQGISPLTVEIGGITQILYHYDLAGYYFFYGDGNEIDYANSGISLNLDGYHSYYVYSMDLTNGVWTKELTNSGVAPITVNITGRKWITPSQYLMPSVYRASGGVERFYNAENNKYDDGKGGKYTFNNLFDKSDPHELIMPFEDIIPTIKYITNSKGELIGELAAISFDSDDNDSLKEGSDNEYLHSFFYVKLHVFDGSNGFNLFKQALETEEAYIEMTSGNCAACRFEIAVEKELSEDGLSYKFYNPVITDTNGNLKKAHNSSEEDYLGDYIAPISEKDQYVARQQDTSKNEVWIAVKKDIDTFGIIMPNVNQGYKPSVADSFVITGIKLPDSYIIEAEERLDAALIKGMKENNDEKFTFPIKFSRNFIALNEDFSEKLNENAQVTIRYNGIDYPLYVSNYTCKADENILYEISVELSSSLSVSQSALKTELNSIKNEIYNNLSGKQSSSAIKLIKTNDTTPASDSNVFSALRSLAMFLRKDAPDSTNYLLKLLGGLEVGETVDSMLTGKGTLVTKDGRIQTRRLEVSGSMTVMDLIVNMLQGMAADYSFTDLGKITQVDDLGDDTYRLWLEKRTDYDFTTFGEQDVCYSIVNTLYKGGTDYYTSWMRVLTVNLTENTLTVVLYPDSEVPGGKNYAPVAGYNMTRRGNATVPADGEVNERAQSWLLSSREGRIMFLQNVLKPILEDYNYGVVIGRLPKTAALEQIPVAEDDLGVMADVVIARKFWEFDGNGKLVTKQVFRGEWSSAVAQSDAPYRYWTHEWQNPSTEQNFVTLEQHTVSHLGCIWGCLVDKTTEAPKWNSAAWQMVQGDPNYYLSFDIADPFSLRPGNVDMELTALVRYGNDDITDVLMATVGVEVEWTRDTGDAAADNAWSPEYVEGKGHNTIRIDHSDATGVGEGFGRDYRQVTLTCRVFIPVGQAEPLKVENSIGLG